MGINTRDDEGSAEAFVRAHHVPYPSFFDQDGSLLLQLAAGVPGRCACRSTIILDKQHRVAAAIYGPTTATTLEDIVRPLEREA